MRKHVKQALIGTLAASTLVPVQPDSSVDAAAREKQREACPTQPPAGSVSVVDFGAIPDDGDDDSASFQGALDSNDEVWVPAGSYDISGSLQLNDDQYLAMHCNATLVAAPRDWAVRGVLEVDGKSAVTIYGGTVDGQAPANPDGRAFGLFIRGEATDINVSDSTFLRFPAGNSGGDGVYIGPSSTQTEGEMPVNVALEEVSSVNNVRQGLTIAGGSQIVVHGGSYSAQVGGNPGAGIDIEPSAKAIELADVPVQGVLIEGAVMENNGGSGIRIAGGGEPMPRVRDVQILGNTFRNNLLVRDEPGAMAETVWTTGSSVEIGSNLMEVRRGFGGIVLGINSGDTMIHDNELIGMNDASWAINRQVNPGEPPAGDYCVWDNVFSDTWHEGHVAPDKGFIEDQC